MEPCRQHPGIIVCGLKRDNRRGANHHEHQRDERREDEDPDWKAVPAPGKRFSGASPRPDSQIHSLLPIARSLTRPGISAQNHPNRLASGRATRKATGASSQVTDNVKASADEMLRYEMAEVNFSEQMKPHITGSSNMIKATNTP